MTRYNNSLGKGGEIHCHLTNKDFTNSIRATEFDRCTQPSSYTNESTALQSCLDPL